MLGKWVNPENVGKQEGDNLWTQSLSDPRSSSIKAIRAFFVEYYNYRRYHKALGNVAPTDVLYGRREQILQRRKEVQIQTINRRRDYNQGLREFVIAT